MCKLKVRKCVCAHIAIAFVRKADNMRRVKGRKSNMLISFSKIRISGSLYFLLQRILICLVIYMKWITAMKGFIITRHKNMLMRRKQ